eukprot:Hpha_TRINITY_DN14932_c0_g2::TRINITY_DN14932_c0_g2_i3::g.143033::m.143033
MGCACAKTADDGMKVHPAPTGQYDALKMLVELSSTDSEALRVVLNTTVDKKEKAPAELPPQQEDVEKKEVEKKEEKPEEKKDEPAPEQAPLPPKAEPELPPKREGEIDDGMSPIRADVAP